jgi:hypothetical protein
MDPDVWSMLLMFQSFEFHPSVNLVVDALCFAFMSRRAGGDFVTLLETFIKAKRGRKRK